MTFLRLFEDVKGLGGSSYQKSFERSGSTHIERDAGVEQLFDDLRLGSVEVGLSERAGFIVVEW